MRSAVRLNSTPIRNSFGFALSFGPLPRRISRFQLIYFCPRERIQIAWQALLKIADDGLSSRALRDPFSWGRSFSITTTSWPD